MLYPVENKQCLPSEYRTETELSVSCGFWLDSRRLALVGPTGVDLRNAETGARSTFFPWPMWPFSSYACHPSTGRVVREDGGGAEMLNLHTGELSSLNLDVSFPLRLLMPGNSFSPDGRYLAVWDDDRVFHLFLAADAPLRRLWSKPMPQAETLQFSPDGKLLFVVGWSMTHLLRTWTGEAVALPELAGRMVAFRNDGRQLAVVGRMQVDLHLDLTLWDWPKLTKRRQIATSREAASLRSELIYSPDGKRLAAVMSSHILLWDLTTTKEQALLKGWDSTVTPACCVFTRDGKWLLHGDAAGTLRRWAAESGKLHSCFVGHTGEIVCLAIADDGNWFISADKDGGLRRWRLEL